MYVCMYVHPHVMYFGICLRKNRARVNFLLLELELIYYFIKLGNYLLIV